MSFDCLRCFAFFSLSLLTHAFQKELKHGLAFTRGGKSVYGDLRRMFFLKCIDLQRTLMFLCRLRFGVVAQDTFRRLVVKPF